MTVFPPRRAIRARLIDVACIAVSALVVVSDAGAAEDSGTMTGRTLFWFVVLGGVGCVALWWRRSHPIHVALLLAPILALTDFVGGAVLIAVYTVAANRRWPVAVAVALLQAVAHVPHSFARPDPMMTVPVANGLNVALLAIAVALGTAVRFRREHVASLRHSAARAEAEAGLQVERLRALERERIAREMHDVLAHRISLVSLHAGALEIRPGPVQPEEVARAAATIRASAHQALEDLREILGVLRAGTDGGTLRPQPALGDLDELLAECRSAPAPPVEVDDRRPDSTPPPSVSRTAYRIVQEGLTNARKHAPGEPVRLCLDRTPAGELHVPAAQPAGERAGPDHTGRPAPGWSAWPSGSASSVDVSITVRSVARTARSAFHLEALDADGRP